MEGRFLNRSSWGNIQLVVAELGASAKLSSDRLVFGEDIKEGLRPPAPVALAAEPVIDDSADTIRGVPTGVVPEEEVSKQKVTSAGRDRDLLGERGWGIEGHGMPRDG